MSVVNTTTRRPKMFLLAFAAALAISTLAGLPGDWARRRATRGLADTLNLVTVAGMLAGVAAVGAIGVVHGFAAVTALVLGLIAGQQAADTLATRRWGLAVDR
jgi:hypothetical protein